MLRHLPQCVVILPVIFKQVSYVGVRADGLPFIYWQSSRRDDLENTLQTQVDATKAAAHRDLRHSHFFGDRAEKVKSTRNLAIWV
jgi:hypothetical protein